jgi:sigma-E factor negative regulatory protein RseB
MPNGMLSWKNRRASLVLLVLFAATAQAGEDSSRDWITRMNKALTTRNYQGVLVHQTGPHREVLRIVHRVQDGRVNERTTVVSPLGPGAAEFVRNGTEWMAYYPEQRFVLVQTRNRSYGFLTTLNGFSSETRRYYDVSDGGSVPLEGWVARRISLEPRDALRYGYRFWLDEKTALPLKTQLVASSGEVIEEISFISLTLPQTISDEQLKPKFDASGFRWMKRKEPLYTPGLTTVFKPRNELLPAGFRVWLFTSPEEEAKAPGPRTRFIVSDGIGWVSVVVEQTGRNPNLNDVMGPRDKARVARNARPDGVVVMGSSAAYVAKVDDFNITVVGEVPPATVKAIAEAVLPE